MTINVSLITSIKTTKVVKKKNIQFCSSEIGVKSVRFGSVLDQFENRNRIFGFENFGPMTEPNWSKTENRLTENSVNRFCKTDNRFYNRFKTG